MVHPKEKPAGRFFAKKSQRDLWVLRFIALMISILLWMTVLGGKRVEITKTVNLDYRLGKDLVIANKYPLTVVFRVTGPRAFLKEFEDRSMSIPIDLRESKMGDYDVVIREEMLEVPLGLKVVSVSPQVIPVKIDRAVTKRVPIRAAFVGALPQGMKVTRITMKPSTVEVRGAQSRLQSLDVIPTAPIALGSNSLRQEFDTTVSLEDLPGATIEDQDRVIHVVAELEGSLSRKWITGIPVRLSLDNGQNLDLAAMKKMGIDVSPSTLRFFVEGPDNLMKSLAVRDVEVWADLGELKKGTHRVRLDWRLAPEIRVVRRSSDWVDVNVP